MKNCPMTALSLFRTVILSATLFLSTLPLLSQTTTDTDGDTWPDADEVALGTSPTDAASFPRAGTWSAEITRSAPGYWYRFEQTDPTLEQATNSGTVAGFTGVYGAEIASTNFVPSVSSNLGKALEFTGPANTAFATGKYVDFGAGIPELTNFRPPSEDKTTTVEYWIKTSHVGTHGNNTWESPSLLARESGGDGDMYWGWLNGSGDFGFSTSDIMEIFAQRDSGRDVTDDQWHHIVLIKEWHTNALSRSTLYIDGGARVGGATITRTTPAGNPSYQDAADSAIQYLGFTQSGGAENVQYVGLVDEVAIYNRALSESEVRLHYSAVVPDPDGDGIPSSYETANGMNPAANDAAGDLDGDGLSNGTEFSRGTNPRAADTDGDGIGDAAETGTGTYVNSTNTGTNPLLADTDADGYSDAVENNSGTFLSVTNTGTSPFNRDTDGDGLLDGYENNSRNFVNATNTGTSPLLRDTDNDAFEDGGEVIAGTNPNSAASVPRPGTWAEELTKSAPSYWYRFEETDPATQTATNRGSVAGFNGTYGPGMTTAELGRPSVLPALGTALEFTGPPAPNSTTKYVDYGAIIPELTNFRPPTVDKTTTVEYWIRTSQTGSRGANTWESPALLARESGGDGDMYWGWINSTGDFGFSTSDIREIYSQANGSRDVTDGQWHHIVLVKEWHVSSLSRSIMYIDGGTNQGGRTIIRTTPAGNPSYQDSADGGIRYLGFTEAGGGTDLQYIGLVDEVAIYNRALTETEVRLHYRSVTDADTDGDGMPDAYEISNGLNPVVNDSAGDPDADGSSNLTEYQRRTNPQNADSDGDGLRDGVETGTGTYVGPANTGTNPLDPDSDDDGLGDAVETNTGTFVNSTNTGTSPFRVDSDGDGFKDRDEITIGTNPNSDQSKPVVPATFQAAITNDAPLYWWRFEETTAASGVTNAGSLAPAFNGLYGSGVTDADLGKTSATPALGFALELTGPRSGNATTKFVDFQAEIPELVNYRGAEVDGKTTTVEYWIKTTNNGTAGNNTWESPSLLAHESGGDGDMYWGFLNFQGELGFSTSDIREIYAPGIASNQWHHVMMVKTWNLTQPSLSALYIDGGALNGGLTYEATTPAGAASFQDPDGFIQYLGFTQSGGGGNVQYIGLVDEVAIYNRALTEAHAKLHFLAAGGANLMQPRFNPPSQTNRVVTLTWTGTGRLQEATTLTGTNIWSDVNPQPTTNRYSTPATGTMKFYRLIR